jgi:hypothetical protein
MARHRTRAYKVVVSDGKVCEGLFHLHKEGSKSLVECEKQLKETRLRVVSWWATQASSTEMWKPRVGDSKLHKTNPRVNPLVCLLVFLLADLLK